MAFDYENVDLQPEDIKNVELVLTKLKEACRLAAKKGQLTYDNMDDIRQCSDDELENTVRYVPSFSGQNINEIVEYALDMLDDENLDDSIVKIAVVPEQGVVLHKKKLFGRKEQLDNYGLHITVEWETE